MVLQNHECLEPDPSSQCRSAPVVGPPISVPYDGTQRRDGHHQVSSYEAGSRAITAPPGVGVNTSSEISEELIDLSVHGLISVQGLTTVEQDEIQDRRRIFNHHVTRLRNQQRINHHSVPVVNTEQQAMDRERHSSNMVFISVLVELFVSLP